MPRESLIVQIFVASPSDVAEERTTVDSVVAELNRTWMTSLGVSFEIVKWETNVRPGFSDDAQAVINAQIPADYDVFIGIFWTRIGSPTSRAESGSVEEFERAYSRFKRSGNGTPEIMLYFKDAPIAPSKLDGDQVKAVAEFRARCSALGGLVSGFEDAAGFEASLRAHLSSVGQKFSIGRRTEPASTAAAADASGTEVGLSVAPLQDDDFGILDYLDVYTTRMSDMSLAATTIGEATRKLGEQVSQRSSEITAAGKDIFKAKKIFKLTAGDMHSFADTTNAQVVLLSAARKEAFDALSNALALAPDFPADLVHLYPLRESLSQTISTIEGMKGQMTGMQTAALSLPRVNQDLNRGKRAVSDGVQKLLTELDSIQSTVRNLIDALDRLLAEPKREVG